jgi:NTP pyrophosphatase (non-canonical NTP hydrolase)
MSLVLLATTHRVAPGILTWPAWQTLRRASHVLIGSADHPQLPYLREAEVPVEVAAADPRALVELARSGEIVWVAAPDGDEDLLRAIGAVVVASDDPVDIEVRHASYDLPGARLLDLVSVMDTLRRDCPWDRKQTHRSLAPYLLEEAYELHDTIEGGDLQALREELGDVLMQVAFHAVVASERTDETRFTIDDVAAGIVDKLVRRHPHVFGDVTVADADEVNANWEQIKAAERAAKSEEHSIFDGVAMGRPALSLAAQLQRRAARAEAPEPLFTEPGEGLGAELFALVSRARQAGEDPEAELRAAARAFRDRVQAWERTQPRDHAE